MPEVLEAHDTIIIGGGQAGLAMSYQLRQRGLEHLLIDRFRLGGTWHSERWDSLHFQFPNWSLRLPGHEYHGDDPEGFSHHSKVVEFLEEYARKLCPPLRLGQDVRTLRQGESGFLLDVGGTTIAARNVVVATGAFATPQIPCSAAKINPAIAQLHSSVYRRPDQLPDGAVLVVGSGSSGGQIAEELIRSGRNTLLSVSSHRRVPRRFLGRDMLWWFTELGWMDRTIDSFPGRKQPAAILLSGVDGGHDLDVRAFERLGMRLFGRFVDADNNVLQFAGDLMQRLEDADAFYATFVDAAAARARELGMPIDGQPTILSEPISSPERLDLTAAGVTSIIWCTGYRSAFDWIHVPVFGANGAPLQRRGETSLPGLYFLGLHWMNTFGSGATFGVGKDAQHLADLISVRP